jgi:hypothetical protein
MAKIRTLRSQNKDLRVAQPSNSFLERFAKNRGKLPIIRARTRESRKKIGQHRNRAYLQGTPMRPERSYREQVPVVPDNIWTLYSPALKAGLIDRYLWSRAALPYTRPSEERLWKFAAAEFVRGDRDLQTISPRVRGITQRAVLFGFVGFAFGALAEWVFSR